MLQPAPYMCICQQGYTGTDCQISAGKICPPLPISSLSFPSTHPRLKPPLPSDDGCNLPRACICTYWDRLPVVWTFFLFLQSRYIVTVIRTQFQDLFGPNPICLPCSVINICVFYFLLYFCFTPFFPPYLNFTFADFDLHGPYRVMYLKVLLFESFQPSCQISTSAPSRVASHDATTVAYVVTCTFRTAATSTTSAIVQQAPPEETAKQSVSIIPGYCNYTRLLQICFSFVYQECKLG